MVDWDRVERLRGKGWDWDRIADDASVDFHADSGAGDPGRALRTLYYQRRSRAGRRGGGRGTGDGDRADDRPKWSLLRASFILTPLVAVWFVLAYVFPSPVGVFVSAIPVLAIVLFAVVAVLAFSLFRATDRWNTTFRNGVVMGSILGLVIAGSVGLAAISEGCPSLTPVQSTEPGGGWTKAGNAAWTDGGAPVFFFYGAVACPYCSASSWSIWYALSKVGTVTGVQYGHSSSSDVYANTPEVILDALSVQSQYVSFQPAENHDPVQTVGPVPGSCVQQAYVSAYDSSGIPFVVLNGQYIHQGTLVDPTQLAGLPATEVMEEIQNQSGTAWSLISPPAYWIMAYIVHLNGGNPQSVANIAQVQQDLSQIS
ncbi:MAG TPA: DUF929 family protein [Thermoplasmata archaeon]|nr:DUF929 family protein [Thermoplasmata archaeon]